MGKVRLKAHKRKLPVPFLLFATLPTAFLLVVFMIVPTVQALLMSFQEVDMLTMEGTFAGLKNFAYLLKDRMFVLSFQNTLKLIIVIPLITLSVSFVLAFVLQQFRLREIHLYI